MRKCVYEKEREEKGDGERGGIGGGGKGVDLLTYHTPSVASTRQSSGNCFPSIGPRPVVVGRWWWVGRWVVVVGEGVGGGEGGGGRNRHCWIIVIIISIKT